MSSDNGDSFTWCNESPRRLREPATPVAFDPNFRVCVGDTITFTPCNEKDLSKRWKEQYSDLIVSPFLKSNVYDYALGTHVMPVAQKAPRGRPNERTRKKPPQEKKSKKAAIVSG